MEVKDFDMSDDKYVGYKFDKTEPADVPETITNGGVIKVYYVSMAEPSLQLTKTALKDDIVYIPDSNNTFTYRLKVENTVENSYPAIVEGTQIITDTLPEGITVVDKDALRRKGITVQENNEGIQTLTWTVSNIGYDTNAKYVDIDVKIDEKVFENQRVDAGDETTVLDVNFSHNVKGDISHSKTDRTGKVMNLFLRTAGATNKNDGYIYAGTVNANTRAISGSTFASDTYNNDAKVNSALKNPSQLEDMLDDFVTANEDGTMAQYIDGRRLPTKADVNEALRELYNGTVTLSDTQIVLWYKVVDDANDPELERYYRITDDGRELFGDYVELSACTYHLDGIIVDVSDLGTIIPAGAQVDVTNTAKLLGVSGENGTSSATVSIHYKNIDTARSGILTTNLLSSTLESIENETINAENVEQIAEKAEEVDKKDNTTATENVVEEPKQDNENIEEEVTTPETDNKEEETTSEENTTTEPVQPQEPVSEENNNSEEITASDDINKDTAVPTTQETVEAQEVKAE